MRPEVGGYVKAVYDFTAQGSGELSLQTGDIIRVTEDVDGSWLRGEAIQGAQGSFPANFVEPLALPDVRMGQRVFVALVDFPADQSGDLELSKGDILLGMEQVDDHWWRGKIGPLRGIFPLSCVQELDTVTQGPRSRSASLKCRSGSLKARSDSLAQMSEQMFARALVDVIPQIEGELGFQTGDLITVTEVVDDDWFYGQCHNKVGLVSTICIEFLDDLDGDACEPAAGRSVQASASSGGDGNTSVRESRGTGGDDGGDRVTSVSSELTHRTRSGYHSSASYTRENTRSHDAEITPYAKTLFPFQAQLPTELSFGENEIVTLVQHVDEDWIEGELDGKFGLFPATFVEIIVDCPYAYHTTKVSEGPDDFTAASEKQPGSDSGADGETQLQDYGSGEVQACSEQQTTPQSAELSSGSDPSTSARETAASAGSGETPDGGGGSSGTGLALVLHNFSGEVQGDLNVREGDTIEVLCIVDSDWLEARDEGGMVGLVPQNHVQVISGAPQSIATTSSRSSAETASGTSMAYAAVSVETDHTSGSSDSKKSEEEQLPGSDFQDSSVASAAQDVASRSPGSTSGGQTHRPSSPAAAVASCPSPTSKPTPLKPKPKLGPKPAIKVKPFLAPKPGGSRAGPTTVGVPGQVRSPTQQHAPRGPGRMEGRLDSPDSSRKVFSNIEVDLPLDNLVRVELEKAKSEGERSRGSSIIGEDKQSRSGSFSSTVSEEPNVSLGNLDAPHHGSSEGSQRVEGVTEETTQFLSDKPHSGSDHSHVTGDGETLRTENRNSPRPMSGSDLKAWTSPSSAFNRSLSDDGPSPVSRVTFTPPAAVPPKAGQRYSMPPSRPAPVMPRPDGKGVVNVGFQHDEEARLISLEEGTVASRAPHPSRAVPQRPASVQLADGDLMGWEVERRVKRPPPRPSGPRIASVPSRTPLQPLRVEGSKPIPYRPAPTAPGVRRSAPVASPSSSTPQVPPPPAAIPPRPASMAVTIPPSAAIPPRPASMAVTTPSPVAIPPRPASMAVTTPPPVAIPPRPASMAVTTPPPAAMPPRPASIAVTTPPKRPPPRLQKSPHDLMRFSPEPLTEEGETSQELVDDLKNRLKENRIDIQKYEQSRQELESKLALEEMQEERKEEGENLDTLRESLHFVIETLHGLREEERRLKGNLFSVSPREEKLEKARLLAEQRAADERQRRDQEEKSAAEQKGRRREKRHKVLQELVETEKDYLLDLHLCMATFFDDHSPIRVPSSVDIEYLFGNMEEIADVAQRLLTSLESAISGKAFSDQIIGSTFVALAEDMKNTYAPYCRHHDDVIAVMEKCREVPEAMQYFAAKVEEMRRRTNIFDVEAMLIKPVQRILKYPLLLHELMKSTEDDHPDKAAINNAIRAMTDVATAINEYKRRKDLVYKYKRDSDQSFAMKIAKLNFHSIKKKSSRMRGRLSTNLGIGLQLRDESFEQEETKFRSAEKAVKVLLRNIMVYMDHMQEVVSCQENLAADISDYFGEKTCEEASRYLTVHRELLSHYKTLMSTVAELVLSPLNKLVAMFNGPNNVIDKRFDKLLDYNNLLGRGKDEKLVQAAKKDYEAMNDQLLVELPRLYGHTLTLLQHCMAACVRAQRDFQDHALKENCILLQAVQQLQKLPSVLGGSENVMDNFNIRHTSALDQISLLSFIPRGFNPKMDAFRRGSTRQSCDPAKPPPIVSSSSQSDSQRAYLRQMYDADNLYQVTQTMAAQDLMDMAVTVGTLVAVIKDKDPMGGRQRWFVDDGVNKGFVQSSILTKPSLSPVGSASSLSTLISEEGGEGGDGDDLAAPTMTYSPSMDEGDALPWLTSGQDQSADPQLYPPVTPVTALLPAADPTSAQPQLEYCAEYPFSSRGSNEVSLVPGQMVSVISQHDLDGNAEWWLVDADGYQGYVPANYLSKM